MLSMKPGNSSFFLFWSHKLLFGRRAVFPYRFSLSQCYPYA